MAGTRIASISGLRGIIGDGLDPVVAAEFAAAYAGRCEPGGIVVGHDGRVSAGVFSRAVEAAVMATGHDVWSAGPVATPTMGVLIRQRQAAGGIQISASHNPPTYNGLKFFQPGGMVLSPSQGREVLNNWQNQQFSWSEWDKLGQCRTIEDPDEAHLERVLSVVDVPAIRRREFVVALDGCHGSGGRLAARLLRSLGCRPLIVGGEPDGRYDHMPEPTEKNLRGFASIVSAVGAAVGFAQDPDADRLAIIDEKGQYIGEELTLALATTLRLQQSTGPIVLNLSTSRVTEELGRRAGCQVIRTPVGEINVVEAMLQNEALIGGEGNGGVIDPRIGYVRDSFAGIALVLDLLARGSKTLSQWVEELPRFAMVKDQYPLRGGVNPTEVASLWDRLSAAFPAASSDRRDGLRLDWDDRWVHVRGSNTEPIVRVIAESADGTISRSLADEVGQWISGSGEPQR